MSRWQVATTTPPPTTAPAMSTAQQSQRLRRPLSRPERRDQLGSTAKTPAGTFAETSLRAGAHVPSPLHGLYSSVSRWAQPADSPVHGLRGLRLNIATRRTHGTIRRDLQALHPSGTSIDPAQHRATCRHDRPDATAQSPRARCSAATPAAQQGPPRSSIAAWPSSLGTSSSGPNAAPTTARTLSSRSGLASGTSRDPAVEALHRRTALHHLPRLPRKPGADEPLSPA